MPPESTSKAIPNPRRLLILTPTTHSQSIIPPLLHTLTGTPVTTPPTTTTTSTPTPPLSSSETLVPSIATTTTTTTFAGYTTHPPLHLRNKYYTADIPIWVDEIPLSAQEPSITTETGGNTTLSPTQWKTEFSSPEAQVVRDAIGAVMICLRNPVYTPPPPRHPGTDQDVEEDVEDRPDVRSLKDFVKAVGEVRALIEEERGGMGEVPGLVVLVGEESAASGAAAGGSPKEEEEEGMEGLELDEPFSVGWWEDQVCEMGLMGMEVVEWDKSAKGDGEGRNRYGELQGMRRIKEVLETHDWATTEPELLDDGFGDELERELLGLDDDDTVNGFDVEVDELQREMVGLRMAIERGGDDFDGDEDEDDELRVDAVEALLLRMRAIKDMSAELPETERKRFAAKAVRDIMKEL
ncbi:adaptin-binding domain-containing protein [Aspergillus ibericus CBS 121593]|uniref:Alpha and gamma adaptin binding protein p34 n=1 Tax=Aspergillus ibericus CBS 121593 TaxID=1448316 RepID=A0A395H942_9EURO|nr:hypothetical protein BO80DRAFT_348543 [Aspergillus ibericus CBS 121593]RAL04033.1 hypothetical protein BO80DRAFT_348543 [Aspergillus ibericus CBS 121593]